MGSCTEAPGADTSTAWSRKSGSASGRRRRPPFACGLALIRRCALRGERPQRRDQPAVVVEELLGPVGPHPLLELRPVRVVLAGRGQRDLVGAPGPLDLDAVHHGRPGPALGGDEEDHRPRPPLEVAVLAGGALDLADRVVGPVERRGQLPVHVRGVVALDGQHLVAVAAQQAVAAPPAGSGRARSGWRSCSRSGAGSGAPRRRGPGRRTCSRATTRPADRSRTHRRPRLRRRRGRGCPSPRRRRARGT